MLSSCSIPPHQHYHHHHQHASSCVRCAYHRTPHSPNTTPPHHTRTTEVRQEAVQQALAALKNRPKPSLPMPSKRSSVLNRSPERDHDDSGKCCPTRGKKSPGKIHTQTSRTNTSQRRMTTLITNHLFVRTLTEDLLCAKTCVCVHIHKLNWLHPFARKFTLTLLMQHNSFIFNPKFLVQHNV